MRQARALHLVEPTWSPLTFEGVDAVEIVAPDPKSATLLLAHAASSFPAALIVGSGSTVRFQPPPTIGANWVVDLFELVERWLKATSLPSAKAFQAGESFVIRVPPEPAWGNPHMPTSLETGGVA